MTKQEFKSKRKEYEDAEDSDQYYNENKQFCSLMGDVLLIEEAVDDSFSIISGDEYEIDLDQEAIEAIQKVLVARKNRMIECFTL